MSGVNVYKRSGENEIIIYVSRFIGKRDHHILWIDGSFKFEGVAFDFAAVLNNTRRPGKGQVTVPGRKTDIAGKCKCRTEFEFLGSGDISPGICSCNINFK